MKRTQKLFGNWWVAIGAPLVLGLVMAACEGPVESTSHNYEAKLYPESTIWVQGAGASINFNAKVLKDGKEDSAAGLSYWQASGMDNGTTVSGGTLQIAATQIGNSITVTGVNTVLGISASTTVTAVSQADMYNALKALRDSSGDFIAKLKAVPGVNASLVSNGAASFYTAQISTQLSSLPSVWNPGSESQSNAENFVRIVRDINNILKQNEGRDQSAEEELVREFNNARTNAGTKDQFIAALIPLLTEANFRTLWPNNTHLTTGKYELYAVFDDGQKKNVAALMYNTSTFGALETVKSAITGAIGQVQSLALNTLASQYQGKSASELLDFLNRTNFILMGFTDDEWQKFNNLTPAQKM
ncbi:MAG: hypothetical protein LBG72_00460, partial [Spirochaetaceae bacterium]|nr:hypothetical protein [Spirochaetaceae bacterium]